MDKQIELKNIFKNYGKTVKTPVLKDVSISFLKGEFAAIIGQSGSGKSTLLNMIGVLDRPDSGEMLFEGANIYKLDDNELAAFRSKTLGFVFQFHYLLPEFSALENVLMPYRIVHGKVDGKAKKRAQELLERVGVIDRMNNKAINLSGGQQQRVAIAQSLMNDPKIILADEPTGNLDSDSGESVRELLREINIEKSTTFIIVTHDRHIAATCDRVIEIADGRIVDDLVITGHKQKETWEKIAPCYCRIRQMERLT